MAEFYKMNPAKWDNGTANLTLEQEAAYLRIINAINKADEPCPANPHVLAGLFRCNTQKAKRLLRDLIDAEKVWVEGGKIYNEHAMGEVQVRRELRATRQAAGKLGGTQKQLNAAKPLESNEPDVANATPREEKRREDTDTNVSGADAPRSLTEIIYSDGLKLLLAGGVSEKEARSLLGMWRKQHGDPALIGALSRAQATGAIEPIRFIQGCFKNQRGEHDPLVNQGIRRLGDEDRRGNFSGGGDSDPPPRRNATNPLPGMQRDAEEKIGPLPERDVEARRDSSLLPSLRMEFCGVLR